MRPSEEFKQLFSFLVSVSTLVSFGFYSLRSSLGTAMCVDEGHHHHCSFCIHSWPLMSAQTLASRFPMAYEVRSCESTKIELERYSAETETYEGLVVHLYRPPSFFWSSSGDTRSIFVPLMSIRVIETNLVAVPIQSSFVVVICRWSTGCSLGTTFALACWTRDVGP